MTAKAQPLRAEPAERRKVTDVFFDFFGTLVDYDPGIHPKARNAPHEFAMRQRIAASPGTCDQLWQRAWDELEARTVDTGREYSMRDIANRYSSLLGLPGPPASADVEALIRDYLVAWATAARVADGALECVHELSRTHRLTVVSNTHDARLVPMLMRRFGLDGYFSSVVTSVEVGTRKPHPKIFQSALGRHGIAPGAAVYIGDNWAVDIEGARHAGLVPIYVGLADAAHTPTAFDCLAKLVRSLG